jgi:hypothetical protein
MSIERVGFLRIKWSSFHWFRAEDFEEVADGYSYADGAIVLGLFVYRYRVWRKAKIKND